MTPKDPIELIALVKANLESAKTYKALLLCHDFLRDIEEEHRLKEALKPYTGETLNEEHFGV